MHQLSSSPQGGIADRYEKQIKFKHIGKEEQEELARKKVAVVGLGGLGSMEAQLLARAGVGTLVLVDPDYVEITNLHRQLLYDEGDVDKLKAVVAREKLSRINSSCKYVAHITPITSDNVDEILHDVDVVVDGLDDMHARYILNDYCVKAGKPLVHAAVAGSIGVVFNILPRRTPCLQCLYPKELVEKELQTYDIDTAGALNMAIATVGAIAACEALKILLNKNISEELIYVDLWKQEFQKVKIEKDASCPACRGRYVFLEEGRGRRVVKLSKNKFFVFHERSFDFEKAIDSLKSMGYAVRHDNFVAHVAESGAIVSFLRNGDALVKNVSSEGEALRIYETLIERASSSVMHTQPTQLHDEEENKDKHEDIQLKFFRDVSEGNETESDKKEFERHERDDAGNGETTFLPSENESEEKKEEDDDLFFPNPFQ